MENVFKKKRVKNFLRAIAPGIVPFVAYMLLHLFWFTSRKRFYGIKELQKR